MSKNDKLLQYWIEQLGLQDWDIELYDNCSPKELSDSDSQGETRYHFTNKMAKIYIVSDRDRQYDTVPFDYEHILVQELLHIKFAILDDTDNSLQNKTIHQFVEDFAKILMKEHNNDT